MLPERATGSPRSPAGAPGKARTSYAANPRASRTVPFTAKATGVPLVELACRLLLGEPLADLDLPERAAPTRACAKEAIFPSDRFPGADDRGPEMRSTGEVMAGGATPGEAYARALRAAGRAHSGGRIGAPLQLLPSQ
jgi:carbamoyl-phosphate synthase large subunit